MGFLRKDSHFTVQLARATPPQLQAAEHLKTLDSVLERERSVGVRVIKRNCNCV